MSPFIPHYKEEYLEKNSSAQQQKLIIHLNTLKKAVHC